MYYLRNAGDPVDAEPGADQRHQGLRGVESHVHAVGAAVVLVAQPLPGEHEGVAGRGPEAAHLQGVPEEVPLDPGPHRRRILLQGLRFPAPTSFRHYVVLNSGCAYYFVKFRNILIIMGILGIGHTTV